MTTETTAFITPPLSQRLLRWSDERFPLSHGLLFAAMYGSTMITGRAASIGGAIQIAIADAIGFFAMWSFFLLLRVLDEHKDYELDCLNHPQRVLQSGQITLAHLRGVGAVAVAIMAGASLAADRGFGHVTSAWLMVMVWTALMTKEFFVADWLKPRLVPYAISHMAVMVLVAVWGASFGGLADAHTNLALGAMLFFGGATFEVVRKTRGPDEEREHVDSYSKVWGPSVAAGVAIMLFAASAAAQLTIITWATGEVGVWHFATCVPLVAGQLSLMAFINNPSEAGRERNEAVIALSMIAQHGVLITFHLVTRGVSWS